jgi:glyoxylase-like metal-dependent hydrolase (beta-lactamase superfamily II)
MRIIREGELYQLTTMPRVFPVNCYLVEEKAGLTLIDAAMPFSAKGIINAAESIGKPITNIVLTHAHEDHVGALDSIKAAFPDVLVYVSKRDSRVMEGDRSLDVHEEQTPIKGGIPKKLKTRADVRLKEGDRVGSLLSVESPGHTPGSMSFLDTRNNALIAGDAFQTRAGLAVAGDKRLLFPFPAFGTWSKATALKSAKKLAKLKPSLLATGHGEMIKNPVERMEEVIRRFENSI